MSYTSDFICVSINPYTPTRSLSPACTLPLTAPAHPFPVASPLLPLSLQDGFTPLHYVAVDGHTQVVTEMMRDSRVDVNARTTEVRGGLRGDLGGIPL